MLVDNSLVQRYSLTQTLKITLTGENTVTLQSRGMFRSIQLSLPVSRVDPSPIRERRFAAGWAAMSVLMSAVVILTLVAVTFGGHSDGSATALSVVGLVLAGCLYQTYQHSRDVYIFKDARTQSVLFCLHGKRPDAATVEAFVLALKQAATRST